MKIVSSGKSLHSPEFYKKKQKAKRIRRSLYAITFLAIAILTAYFLRWDKFIISEVIIAETIAVDREEIKNAIEKGLEGNYLFVIPKANAFVYEKSVIRKKLLNEFPRFKALELDLRGFKELSISGEEREPYALYCANECFFLDDEGLIFAVAPDFSDGVYIVYRRQEPIENPLGKRFLPQVAFDSLVKFLDSMVSLGVEANSVEIDGDNYTLSLKGGGKLIWLIDTNLNLIYSNLEAFLVDEAIKSQPDFLSKIEYLDLRTENKVFWKLK